MERTWKSKAAGILCIVLGAVFLIPGIVYLPWSALLIIPGIMPIVGGIHALRRRSWALALAGSIFALLNCVVIVAIGGIIALFSNIDNPGAHFELSDRIGIFVGSATFGTLGLLALIFVILGRREFK
jgi:hypothetical protein